MSPKSEKIAMLLAALLGIVGFLGIGHLYVGKIRQGINLLVGAWVVAGASIFCFTVWSSYQVVHPLPGYSRALPPAYSLILFVFSCVLFLGVIALWIWQIFDAKAVCQNYNKQIS
jgi:TM2 domain-containing membrane protein YozV